VIAVPVSIDLCVLASRHETIFEGPEITSKRFKGFSMNRIQ
jgi:hypothetical protein